MGNDLDIKSRERLFHDKRFKKDIDPRKQLSKYYSITFASTDYYRSLIAENISGNRNLLEYGCGTGGDIDLYKSLDCNLYGIDISNEAVIKAEEKAIEAKLSAKYFVGDAENSKFEDNFFNMIVGTGILHHLNIEKSLVELSRIVARDGFCVFCEPLGHNLLINIYRKFTPTMRTPDEHPLLEADLRLMAKYFMKVSVKYFYFFSLGAVIFRKTFLFERIYNSLFAIDNFLIKMFPRFAKHCWLCVICLGYPIKQ